MTQERLLLRKISLLAFGRDPSMDHLFTLATTTRPVTEKMFLDCADALVKTHDLLEEVRELLKGYAGADDTPPDYPVMELMVSFGQKRRGRGAQLEEFELI